MSKRRFEKKKDVLSVSHVGLDKGNDGIKRAFSQTKQFLFLTL